MSGKWLDEVFVVGGHREPEPLEEPHVVVEVGSRRLDECGEPGGKA